MKPGALSLNRTPELGHNQCLKQIRCWALIQLLHRNRAVRQYVLIGQGIVSHCLADSGIMYNVLLRSVVRVWPCSYICRAKQLPLLSPKALTGSHEYTAPQAS